MSLLFDATHHNTLLGISLVTVIQFTSTAIIGGAIGVCLGKVLYPYSKIADGIASSLRIGMWIPILFLWFIPVVRDRAIWLSYVLPSIVLTTTLAVAMATLHDYIIRRSVFKTDGDIFRSACRSAWLQALIVCLFSQPMMSGAGWHWYIGRWRTTASTILVAIVLFIIERLYLSSGDSNDTSLARVLLREFRWRNYQEIKSVAVISLFLVLVWQLSSMTVLYKFISSPTDVLISLSRLFKNNDIWRDICVSTVEILTGVFIGIGIGIIFSAILKTRPALRGVFLAALPITFMTPLMALAIPSMWFFQEGLWPKIAAVSLVSFYPFFRTFWELRDRSLWLRILLGANQVLPLAFIAMLFGESMAATKGLGFSLVEKAALDRDRSEGMAVVLVLISLLALYSWILRSIVKYRYTEQIVSE